MFHRKKSHSWYWHTFWLLLFCLILFAIARFFMKTVSKNNIPQKVNNKKKVKEEAPLFI